MAAMLTAIGFCFSTRAKEAAPTKWSDRLGICFNQRPKEVTSGNCQGRYTTDRSLKADYIVDEQKVLGEGMSGSVKLAVGRCDGCKYAVKSVEKSRLPGGARQALKHEADIYLSLDHPHIARLQMVYETKAQMHLVMEYMEGGELFNRLIAKRTFTEQVSAETAHQMLLALVYLHEHRVAHRDLKLENFLYEKKETDHLKLIDFGLAKVVPENGKMTDGCGTIHYMAPEVAKASYTTQADLWSFGVIVYMMLVGIRPLFSGSHKEIFQKIKAGELHFSSRFAKLSERARDFVESLLVADPEARLTARQALDHPWLRALQTEPVALDLRLLGSLRSFAQAPKFQRKLLRLMAWSLPTEDRVHLRKQFLAIDRERSGTISLQELAQVLREGGCGLADEEEAEDLFRSLDGDGSDRIEYSEFLAATMPDDAKYREDCLRRTFTRFDLNGDGKVSCTEITTVLGVPCTAVEIQAMLREADTSDDGELSLEEFLIFFQMLGKQGDKWVCRATSFMSESSDQSTTCDGDGGISLELPSAPRCSASVALAGDGGISLELPSAPRRSVVMPLLSGNTEPSAPRRSVVMPLLGADTEPIAPRRSVARPLRGGEKE